MKNWQEISEESIKRIKSNPDYHILELSESIKVFAHMFAVFMLASIVCTFLSFIKGVFLELLILFSFLAIISLITTHRYKDFIYKIHEEQQRSVKK